MEDEGRIARLAEIAKNITDRSVYEQFQILGKEGLKLTDINWENCNTEPGLVYVIPTRSPTPAEPPKK